MAWLIRNEQKIVWLVILAVIFISALPIIYGYFQADQDQYFTGSHFFIMVDYPVYLSLIEQGRQGDWLFTNLYTAESQNPVLISPLWLVLGQLGRLTGLSNIFWYHFSRAVLGIIFLYFLYFFLKRFFSTPISRLFTFLLLCFSSGLGSFFIPANKVWDFNLIFYKLPLDLWVAEANTFLSLYHSPLFILSQLLLLVVFYLFLFKTDYQGFLLLFLTVLFLGIIHPYDLVTISVVPLVYLLVKFLFNRQLDWRRIKAWLIIILAALPAGGYYWLITKLEPAIGGWAEQNITLSPPIFSFIIGYGLILFFAVLGILFIFKEKKTEYYFIICWVIAAGCLLNSPVMFQRRFTNGFHIALVILAAWAIFYFWQKIKILNAEKKIILISLLFPILILGLFLTNSIIIADSLERFNQRIFPHFIPQQYYQGFGWLKDNVKPDQVILAEAEIGKLIPAFTAQTVYLGHAHQTIDFRSKKGKIDNWFFRINSQDEQKQEFLKENNISYIWYSEKEEELGDYHPAEKEYLEEVYRNAEVEIYWVKD